ncbi:hypothetical protein H0H92_001534 [Tricholoma furcatifolium]|nr:hypothetical protein H0H92_001534 [Tricholoma furcatifolium]
MPAIILGTNPSEELEVGRYLSELRRVVENDMPYGRVVRVTDHKDRILRYYEYVIKLCQVTLLFPASFLIQNVEIKKSPNFDAIETGGSALVYRGYCREQEVAIKDFKLYDNEERVARAQKRFLKEAYITKILYHPNIISFIGIVQERHRFCIVVPWMNNGNIVQYVKTNPNSEVSRKELLEQVADGLHFIHAYGFAHGDLKGDNILISDKGKALICDFGIAALQDDIEQSQQSQSPTVAPKWKPGLFKRIKKAVEEGSISHALTMFSQMSGMSCEGTRRWMAPERLMPEGFGRESAKATFESDVFSFAMVCIESVHRIKVDEKAGYILTTTSDGGLFVTDLQSNQELWSLPNNHVRPYAHCEYGEGFVIFDYVDGSKEVWRHLDSWNDEEVASVASDSMPTARQRRVFTVAEEKYAVESPGATRGHFRPWAILRPPQLTRAFRFYYPTLGAAGWDHIYLWDVRTGTLIQTIEQTQSGMQNQSQDTVPAAFEVLGDINYIEVSEKYVFLCGTHFLRVFSRASGRSTAKVRDGASLVPQEVVCSRVAMPDSPNLILDEFIGVHISPCGSHLAALMMSSRLIILPDFERALQSNVRTFDIALEVQLGSPCLSSRYLAFENGRISVVTKTGVFIVQPDWTSLATATPDSPPEVMIFRVPALGDSSCLGAVSCLQMTDTGLFLNWDADFLPQVNDDALERMNDIFYETLTDERRFTMTLVDLEGELTLHY